MLNFVIIFNLFSRVTCVLTNVRQHLDVAVNNEERYMVTITSPQSYTWYNCCVEAGYANSAENASSCVAGSVIEGGT